MERNPRPPERERTEAQLELEAIKQIAAEGIERASRYETEVDDGTAAVLALGISRCRTKESPALQRFVRRGIVDLLALRDEYLDVYANLSAAPEAKEWVNWLGTHLLGRADTPAYSSEHYEELLTTTKAFIFENNHKAGLGLLRVLDDWAVIPPYVHEDLDRLENDPEFTAADRVKFVWLRGILLNYATAGERGPRGIPFPF